MASKVVASALLLVLTALQTGCAVGLPPITSIPKDTPWRVRKNIHTLYWDAQCRAQGCLNISHLAIEDVDCSAAIPWLIALLRDEAIAWSPSIFFPYTGTPVHREAATALGCIGQPAAPALRRLLSSDDPKMRERATDILTRIQETNGSAIVDSRPSKEQ